MVIRALPAEGYQFHIWTRSCSSAAIDDINSAATTAVFHGDATLTANFIRIPHYTLSVAGGSGSGSYQAGEEVAIVADPPPEGKAFLSWTGDSEFLDDPSASSTTVTMPERAVSVSAAHIDEELLHRVEIRAGPGGSVIPEGVYQFPSGMILDVEAEPASGHHFRGWEASGGVWVEESSSARTTLRVDAAGSVEALFAENLVMTVGSLKIDFDNRKSRRNRLKVRKASLDYDRGQILAASSLEVELGALSWEIGADSQGWSGGERAMRFETESPGREWSLKLDFRKRTWSFEHRGEGLEDIDFADTLQLALKLDGTVAAASLDANWKIKWSHQAEGAPRNEFAVVKAKGARYAGRPERDTLKISEGILPGSSVFGDVYFAFNQSDVAYRKDEFEPRGGTWTLKSDNSSFRAVFDLEDATWSLGFVKTPLARIQDPRTLSFELRFGDNGVPWSAVVTPKVKARASASSP